MKKTGLFLADRYKKRAISCLFGTSQSIKGSLRAAAVGCALSLMSPAFASGLDFSGGTFPVLSVVPEASTGLESIYVAFECAGLSAAYTSLSSVSTGVKWYRFSNLGGGYAEEITDIEFDGAVSTLSAVTPNSGYIVEEDGRQHCFWVVEYRPQMLDMHSVAPGEEQSCDYTPLIVDGSGGPIHYFTVNGQQKVLDREIEVRWNTLIWDEETKLFVQSEESANFPYLTDPLNVRPASLCPTVYTVSGDRFLKAWNWLQTVETQTITPVAVEVHTEAISENESTSEDEDSEAPGSNLLHADTEGLGGSAPATIDFLAYTSDAVIHHEWQIAADPEFEKIEYRLNQQDLTFTFDEEGTFYVRYAGSNDDGSCEAFGDVYTVTIGASELLIPNAFSPNGDGVNDEWKVAYRSLTEFKCWIFDRYGNEIFSFTDPSAGWDGKRKGKLVPPGVYYYVIQARGADGKKYKKSGDINIIRYKGGRQQTEGDEEF